MNTTTTRPTLEISEPNGNTRRLVKTAIGWRLFLANGYSADFMYAGVLNTESLKAALRNAETAAEAEKILRNHQPKPGHYTTKVLA